MAAEGPVSDDVAAEGALGEDTPVSRKRAMESLASGPLVGSGPHRQQGLRSGENGKMTSAGRAVLRWRPLARTSTGQPCIGGTPRRCFRTLSQFWTRPRCGLHASERERNAAPIDVLAACQNFHLKLRPTCRLSWKSSRQLTPITETFDQ